MSEQRRLLRARDGRVFGGVCMGLAHYLGVDVVLIRLAFVLLALNGLGIGVYVILWILIPDDVHGELPSEAVLSANLHDIGERVRTLGSSVGAERGAMLAGLALVAVGVIALSHRFIPEINFGLLWPMALIALGIFILVRGRS